MFTRFTDEALEAIIHSQKETERQNRDCCGSEMILLGLLAEKYGIAFKALKAAGLRLIRGRQIVENLIGISTGISSAETDWKLFPFSTRAKEILGKAWHSAQMQEIKLIGTGQLLLEILNSKESTAFQVLREAEVDLEKIEELVHALISDQSEYGEIIDGVLPINCKPANLHASLAIIHDELDPEEISHVMGMKASRSYKKMDKKLARRGFWSACSDHIDSQDINEHLLWIINLIEDKFEELKQINDRGFDLSLKCRFDTVHWNTLVSISPAILSKLPVSGLDLDLDIYYNDEDDDEVEVE